MKQLKRLTKQTVKTLVKQELGLPTASLRHDHRPNAYYRQNRDVYILETGNLRVEARYAHDYHGLISLTMDTRDCYNGAVVMFFDAGTLERHMRAEEEHYLREQRNSFERYVERVSQERSVQLMRDVWDRCGWEPVPIKPGR